MKKIYKRQKGMSILEVMLAATLFVIFSSATVGTLLQGIDANRLGQEETVAIQFAQEGIEAVKSIKNQSFSNLTAVNPTPRGVTNGAGNVWTFKTDGTNDVLNSGKNYTRTLKIDSVNRDAGGNIVPAPTGTVDTASKKVTSSVDWTFYALRQNNVSLVSYLTDWRKPLSDGVIMYGDASLTAKWRNYLISSDAFDTESPATSGASGYSFQIRTSPKKREAIAGYVTQTGVLWVLCFDGSNWSNEWSIPTVGGNATTKRFDIAYETNSGDVLVAFSRGVAANNAVDYRTKSAATGCGSANWSSTDSLPTSISVPAVANLTTATVQWIRLEGNPVSSSNSLAIAWNDNSSKLGAAVWDGSSWPSGSFPAASLETNLERITTAGDSLSFDITAEAQTGRFIVAWGVLTVSTTCSAGNCIKYSLFNGSSWTNGSIPTVADSSTNIAISSNPNSNEIILAAIDNGGSTSQVNNTHRNDLSIAYWSGSAWTGFENRDTLTAAPLSGTKLVSTGWLTDGSPTPTTKYVVIYSDSAATNINGFQGSGVTAPTKQASWFNPTPVFNTTQRWYDVQMDPLNKNKLLFFIDDPSRLFAKSLLFTAPATFTWNNSDGGSPLGSNMPQGVSSPFSYAYWRQ